MDKHKTTPQCQYTETTTSSKNKTPPKKNNNTQQIKNIQKDGEINLIK